jgi:hypothetical protein
MERSLWKKKLSEDTEFKIPVRIPPGAEYSQIGWDQYFDQRETVDIYSTRFQIFTTNVESTTIFVFLHGAGFTALSWCLVAVC